MDPKDRTASKGFLAKTHNAGQQSTFGQTQHRPDRHKTRVVSDEAEAHCDNAPQDGQEGQPDLGRDPLQDQVARELAGRPSATELLHTRTRSDLRRDVGRVVHLMYR